MSEYEQIRQYPQKISAAEMTKYLADGCSGVHESTFRSWGILKKAIKLLEKGTPPEVVLELIALMEEQP